MISFVRNFQKDKKSDKKAKNQPFKMKLLCQGIFSGTLISKMGVKMTLRVQMEKYEADSEIEFPRKFILKLSGLTGSFRQHES